MKFIHTADWHIRTSQYGFPFRGRDRAAMVREVLEKSIGSGASCIINGGDVYQSNRPSEQMQQMLFDAHRSLCVANMPMYTVTGNHDASTPSLLTFPNYSGEDKAGVVCIDFKIVEHRGVRIAGFPASATVGDIRNFLANEKPVDIAVWHGAIQDMVPFPMEEAIALSDLPAGPKAWLLGDIHLRQRLRLPDGTLVSYPGTIDLQDQGEPPEKFIDLYELTDDFRTKPFPEPTEIRLNNRPVVRLSVCCDAEADQAVEKVRTTVTEAGRGILVFMRYARSCAPVVQRIRQILPRADSVFLPAPFQRAYESGVPVEDTIGELPTLEIVVDELVQEPSANRLVRQLVLRGADYRQLINDWADAKLNPI